MNRTRGKHMDLKYLQTFLTIVEEGGFSKAAKKLSFTQSTITFQIGQLEQELSVQLFEKIGRRMVLTKAGEQLVPYANEVMASVDRLRFFESDLASCQGSLHLGMAETQLCFRFPDIIGRFCQGAPNARLFLRSMNCYEIRDALLDGTLDLGVLYEDVGGFGSRLETNTIGEFPLVLVAAPETARQFPDFVTPDRQLSVPFLINEPNCIFRQIFEEYLRERSIRLDRTIELWSIPTIKNLVIGGFGITFLPEFSVREELARRELAEIPVAMGRKSITAVCAHHRNKWVSPLMRLFISLACNDVKE